MVSLVETNTQGRLSLTRIGRAGRSILTLNRDREYRILKRLLELKPTDTVLDAGSGDGFWTSRVARYCQHVTGIEPDQKALRYAEAFHSCPNVTYVCGVAESLPFEDSTFDKVMSVSCLEHFADPLRGLSEIMRVLKPGGRLALSVDSLLQENSPLSFREWHKQRHFVTQYFSRDELLTAMEKIGLRCEPERTVHLFRSRVAARLREVFIRRPYFWLPLFAFFYCAVRLSDWTMDDMHGQIIIVSAIR